MIAARKKQRPLVASTPSDVKTVIDSTAPTWIATELSSTSDGPTLGRDTGKNNARHRSAPDPLRMGPQSNGNAEVASLITMSPPIHGQEIQERRILDHPKQTASLKIKCPAFQPA
jgi:hypothetical protein